MEQPAERATAGACREHRRWWRLYVHKIQKQYAIFAGAIIFVYTFMVLFLSMIGPWVGGQGSPVAEMSLTDRITYATTFLFSGSTTWPAAICIFIPAAVMFSLYLTHRVAGPIYRFEESAKLLQQGNLSLRIRLRKGDQLHELAEALNNAISTFELAMTEIRDREAIERKALRQCLTAIKGKLPSEQELKSQLEVALKEGEHIDSVLSRFQFSTPQSPSR